MRCGFNEKIALCFLSVALLLKKEVVKKFLGGTKIREAKFTGSIALNAYNDISKIRSLELFLELKICYFQIYS